MIILLLAIYWLSGLSLQAQPSAGEPATSEAPVSLKGKVVDASAQTPLDYATVSLFNQTDSTLIGGNITDEQGSFTLEVRPGTYYIVVEYLAYQSTTVDNIIAKKGQGEVDLGVIALQPESTALETVVVVGEMSEMQMALDKKVFNVGKDLASRGGTAIDLLDNVPSVQVDLEGNISLRGSSSVRILVDGRPSGLVGISGTRGLRSLQANMIEKIEVITNPSARYEAEGMAGIINIIMKKNQKKGINGSFDLTVGQPDNYGAAMRV